MPQIGSPKLQIGLLGEIAVQVDGRSIARPRSRKDLWLLAHLAVHRGAPQRRQRLIELIWPDLPEDHGRDNLTHTLWRLRRLLGDAGGYVQAVASDVVLSAEVDVDLHDFLQQSSSPHREDHVTAAALWRGMPLAGIDSEWAEEMRRELDRQYRDLLRSLSVPLPADNPQNALEYARLLSAADPYDDEIQRRVMRLAASTGHRNEALVSYQHFADTLSSDLDVEPEPATRNLATRLRTTHLAAVCPRPFDGPVLPPGNIVGRDTEFAALVAELQPLTCGHGATVLLSGEAGMGKTRLAAAIMEVAEEHGVRSVRAAPQPVQSPLPFVLWASIVRILLSDAPPEILRDVMAIWSEHLQYLLPEIHELQSGKRAPRLPASDRATLFTSVCETIVGLARAQPTLIVIDDLQWAGPDEVLLFHALSRWLRDEPLVLLGLYRSEEARGNAVLSDVLADLSRDGGARMIHLAGLQREDILRLLTEMNGNPPHSQGDIENQRRPERHGASAAVGPEQAQRIAHEAGGNPLFAIEISRWLEQRGGDQGIPESIAVLAQSRLDHLTPRTRQIVQLAAVLGTRFDPVILAGAASEDDMALYEHLEEAERVGVIQRQGGDHTFGHDLLREAVYRSLTDSARSALHGRVAEELERHGMWGIGTSPPSLHDIETLTHHFSNSSLEDKALQYIELAADRAQAVFANATADLHYRNLVERLDRLGQRMRSARAREHWAAALRTMGRYADALAVIDRAVETYENVDDAAGLARSTAEIGRISAERGDPETGIARLNSLLSRPRAAEAGALLATPYAVLAILFHERARYPDQLSAAQRAIELAVLAGDRRILAEARGYVGLALINLGRLKEGLWALEETIRLAEDIGDLITLCSALQNAAWAHEVLGRLNRSMLYLQRTLDLAERRGDPAQIAFTLQALGRNAFFAGRWAEARGYLLRAETVGRRGESSWATPYALLELGRLNAAEGNWQSAVAYLTESMVLATSSHDLQAQRTVQRLLAEHDLHTADPVAALARLRPLLDRPGQTEADVTFLLPVLAQAQLAISDVPAAELTAREAIQRASDQQNRRALVDALHVAATIATSQGQWQKAEKLCRQALRLCRAIQLPYVEAQVLEARGLLEAGRQRRERARIAFDEAQAIYHRLGAERDLQRVAAAGARLG